MNVIVDKYEPVMLPRMLTIKSVVTAFEIEYDPGFVFRGEAHNFWEFVWVLDGRVGITAGNDIYELEKNQVIFHKPLEFHRLWTIGNTGAHLMIMSFVAEQNPTLPERVFSVDDEQTADMKRLMDEVNGVYIREEICVTGIKQGMLAESQLFINELEMILITLMQGSDTFKNRQKSTSASNYRRIVEAMNSNLDKSLTVEELADICRMSRSNLKRTFEKYTGEGVIKHFNNMKMHKAVDLLRDGYSVSEISRLLGFNEPGYFSTVFKRIVGSSPLEYKKNFLNGDK